jgi:predicted ABC-type transport system involved in lysophospholipase L1 biosynthesis ATPase subunit
MTSDDSTRVLKLLANVTQSSRGKLELLQTNNATMGTDKRLTNRLRQAAFSIQSSQLFLVG